MQCGLFLLLWFNAQVVKNTIYKGIIGNFIRTSYTFSWGVFGDSHTFSGRLFGSIKISRGMSFAAQPSLCFRWYSVSSSKVVVPNYW